jgi:hypothetical protein
VSWSYSIPCEGYGVSRFGTPYKHKIYMSMAYFLPCLLTSKLSKTYVHFIHSWLEIHEEILGFADLIRKFVEKKLIPKYKTCTRPVQVQLFMNYWRQELHFANMPANTRLFAVHSPFEFNN